MRDATTEGIPVLPSMHNIIISIMQANANAYNKIS
jgi:hypothetical protein